MASTTTTTAITLFFLVTLLSSLFIPSTTQVIKGCPFNSVYIFGDTSLMADHLASVFHIPSPNNPYTKAAGATFATAGATVMPTPFLIERGVQPPPSYNSLDTQIKSFTQLLNTVCGSPNECAKKLQRTLLFVDQIGTNEYKYAFLQGKSIKEVSSYVPQVAEAIKNTIRTLIKAGATHLIVPGSPPMGCFPGYLTLFRSKDPMHYDVNKCHIGLNTFTRLHNDHLRQALVELRMEFPGVEIVYGGYYNAFMAILRNHDILGFKKGSLMKACCGFGGPYNFHPEKMCGDGGVRVCSDPTKYVHWDGFHLTEEATKNVVEAFVAGKGFVYPEFKFPEVMHCIM
ncbi:GDSL esterase/lipase At5g03980-like [Actinidia eriantha]|uniref:GDSL esterase/lipase At5g03980-like n=1 Tax=Actinidia eriantha TaxID=165200 RepID=UPI00258C333A|nr:GDSL esterase/lipase At5g03980-like [Actinidia eriantha]